MYALIGTNLQGFGTKLECWLGTALFDGPDWKRWYFVPKEWRINNNNNNTVTVNVGCPIAEATASVEQQRSPFPSSVWACQSMSMHGMNNLGASSGSAERDWIEDRQTILATPFNGTRTRCFVGNGQKQRFQPYLLGAQSLILGQIPQLPQHVRNCLQWLIKNYKFQNQKKACI